MRSHGSAAELERRRRLAVRRVHEGHTQRQVADFLGVTERTVARWVAAHRDRGDGGLAAKPQPGRPPRLSAGQEAEVLSWLRRAPSAFGFATDLWTAARVAELVRRHLGVTFHPRYLSAWLARRRITPQKPARRAKERDPAAIGRWLAEDWPRIEKKRGGSRPTWR